MFQELEPIRNKTAHNRKATQKDVEVIHGWLMRLESCMGETEFTRLVEKCTCAPDILTKLNLLEKGIDAAFKLMIDFERIEDLSVLTAIRSEWWFDQDYLGQQIDQVIRFIEVVEEYSSLPRKKGRGYIIEQWMSEMDVSQKHQLAQEQIGTLLNMGGQQNGYKQPT